MDILKRLFGWRKMSDGKEIGKTTQGGRSRAIPKLITVLGMLAFVLLLTSVTSPPAGQAAFPGTNGKIVFVSNQDGNYEIYVMNADGTGQTRLTYTLAASESFPRWSPDGTKIVFESDRDGNYEIYVMNADGTDPKRLTNNLAQDSQPAWSPDGSQIAFLSNRDGNYEVYVMNAADGTGQTNLTNNPAFDDRPAWSPDGSKIAFDRQVSGPNFDVYVMNAADGTGQTNLTNNSATDGHPAYSPDGSKIAFHSTRDGYSDIYVMNADGTGQTNLTKNYLVSDQNPAYSPNGDLIAFESWRDGNSEIYVMNSDGTGQTNLTNNSANDGLPDWQPLPDTTPPVLTLPPSMTLEATSSAGAVHTFTATATDDTDPSPSVSCSPPSGSTFPLGTTTVNCTATDASGNSSSGSFTVTVVDTTAPTITLSSLTAPADGFLPLQSFVTFPATVGSQPVTVNGTVSDNVGVASVVVNGIPATVQPDGSWTAADIPFSVGDNTVTASATDTSGNTAGTSVQVTLNLDLDADGIRNNVDKAPPGPFEASAKFSDEALGGTTFGRVLDKCVTTNGGTQCESEGFDVGVTLDVLDEPTPDGVRVVVSGPANSFAKVKLDCSKGNYNFAPGEYMLTCNTVTLTVLQGKAEVEFTIGGAVVVVGVEESSTVILDETIVDGELQELVVAVVEGIATVNGVAVPPGESLTVIRVGIDIKPGSDPNCFNSDGHGVIPVAILSSADFEAAQVDPSTVSLDGQEVRIVGKGNTQAHQEDVNGDGLDDLVVQIEDEDGTYQKGDTIATLTGETFDGIQIQGTDTICIVP